MATSKASKILWVVMPGFAVVATAASFAFHLNLLASTVLFWIAPAIYLTIRYKQKVPRALLYSFLVTITFGLLIDCLANINHAWHTTHTLFSFRLYGLVPLEDYIWALPYVYTVTMTYEALSSVRPKPLLNNYFLLFICSLVVMAITGHAVLIANPGILDSIRYIYLLAGCIFFGAPLALFFYKHPRFIKSFVIVSCLILPLALLNEITALRLNHWYFPSTDFVGRIAIAGTQIPFEESLFFILIGPLGILLYYVHFFRRDR